MRHAETGQATVRSIGIPTGVSLGQHYFDRDCQIPPNSVVMEAKSCENCTRVFFRVRKPFKAVAVNNPRSMDWQTWDDHQESIIYVDTGRRFCLACEKMPFPDLEKQEAYRDLMPGTESQMQHHRLHLPRYDNSLLPHRTQPKTGSHKIHIVSSITVKEKSGSRVGWQELLVRALVDRGPLSYEQMLQITHHSCAASLSTSLNYFKIKLVEVGNIRPRKSCMGPCPKIYQLEFLVHPKGAN